MTRHGNWIGAEERPSKEGLFEIFARRKSERPVSLGEWARSGAREVGEVMDAVVGARAGLRAVEAALGLASAHGDGLDGVAARLGLDASELAVLGAARDAGSFGLGLEPAAHGEVALLVAAADALPEELVRQAAGPLAAGRAVVIVGHEDLPMSADLARDALVRAGVAAGSIAVLHGVTAGGWRALGGLEPRLEARGVLDWSTRDDLAGSQLLEPGLDRLLARLAAPREARFELRAFAREQGLVGAPPDVLARQLVACAFGRGTSLGGRARGTPLCGVIPERDYSAFVDAALGELERRAEDDAPLAMPGGGRLIARYKSAWRSALGEGAVLLCGGYASDSPAGAVLAPTLLVNLPPASRAFALGEPLAQLRLARSTNRA